jgi:hypothetical protein
MDLAGLGRWLSRFESNAAQGTIETRDKRLNRCMYQESETVSGYSDTLGSMHRRLSQCATELPTWTAAACCRFGAGSLLPNNGL